MNHLIRTVVSSAFLATLIACGSDPPPPPLAIQSVTPSSFGARTAGFRISVFGTGFTLKSVILLGDVEVEYEYGSYIGPGDSLLVASIPGGTVGTITPGRISVSIKNPDGTRSNELPLAVTEAPAPVLLGALSIPGWCAGKDPLVFDVLGANFTSDTSLELNGRAISIFRRTETSLQVTASRADLFPGGAPASFKVRVPEPGGGEAVEQLSAPSFKSCMD